MITVFQAHVSHIGRTYSVGENARRVRAITAVFLRNRDNKLLISTKNGVLIELISYMVK